MVRNHADEIPSHFAASETKGKILEAMRNLRNHNSHPSPLIGDSNPAIHLQLPFRHVDKASGNFADFESLSRLCPFHPLEKYILLLVSMLVGMEDIAAMLKNPACTSSNQTGPVRSVKQSNYRKTFYHSRQNILDALGFRNISSP
jgi:hypothetical protein